MYFISYIFPVLSSFSPIKQKFSQDIKADKQKMWFEILTDIISYKIVNVKPTLKVYECY